MWYFFMFMQISEEELDDPKDNCVDHVVFEELEKMRPTEKPKA